MPGPTKIMIIRHGEKPTIKNQPPFGVTQDGEQDWESLTVRGWLRAAGLGRLFNPAGNQFPNDALDRPAFDLRLRPAPSRRGAGARRSE